VCLFVLLFVCGITVCLFACLLLLLFLGALKRNCFGSRQYRPTKREEVVLIYDWGQHYHGNIANREKTATVRKSPVEFVL
jgi:hypothetical protein